MNFLKLIFREKQNIRNWLLYFPREIFSFNNNELGNNSYCIMEVRECFNVQTENLKKRLVILNCHNFQVIIEFI